MPSLITKDPQRAFFEQQSEVMFSMQEIGDFEEMLVDLQVKEVSQHSLFSLINTRNKVTNNISKLDLRAEIRVALFQGESKRVEKQSKSGHSIKLNSKINCYSSPNFSHLTNYKLFKQALVSKGTSKSIIVVKNVPASRLCYK